MDSSHFNVLVVDDDTVTRHLLRGMLQADGFSVTVAKSGEEAISILETAAFPIIISDIRMEDLDGFQFLARLKKNESKALVILITGYGSLEGAMGAIQEGAFDYLSKPVRAEELKAVMRRATEHWQWTHHRVSEKDSKVIKPLEKHQGLIGRSSKMVQVYKMIAKASFSGSNVLIAGESGTGKELVARAIHNNSPLRDKPFVTVNCGALADTLLESELFGHVRGAFTGAVAAKRGLFEEADGGTIFLDEIGDISPALQIKLLRVLQEGEFKPVGSNDSKRVKTRVIAATHRNLQDLVKAGKFREDLFYRLKILLVELPPLRDRMEDVGAMVEHFIATFATRMNKEVVGASDEAMTKLLSYSWPGNIRELEHAVERAVAVTNTGVIHAEDLNLKESLTQEAAASGEPATVIRTAHEEITKSLEEMERSHIMNVLQSVAFNKSKAAMILGIDRATLYRKAQRYGIELGERQGLNKGQKIQQRAEA